MESTIENNVSDAGVLAPSQEDAIPIAQVAAETNNTPVAKKTRRAMRKRMDSTVEESPPIPGPPVTPSSRTLSGETPRRSCRKSVRPPIDYEDIVRSAKKLVSDAVADHEDEQEPPVQKWNVAEVGKNSRKRGRKSKRLNSKKQKTEQDLPLVTGTDSEVKSPEQPEDQLADDDVKDDQLGPTENKTLLPEENLEQPEEKLDQSAVKEMQPEVQTDVHNESQEPQQAVADKPDSDLKVKAASRGSRATRNLDTSAAGSLKKKRKQYKHIVADEDIEELGLAPLDSEGCDESMVDNTLVEEPMAPLVLEEDKSTAKQDQLPEKVVQEEEMPLQELDKSFPEEEMASLIMIDDDEVEQTLNTTFDADDTKTEDQSVILVGTPEVQPTIKVVLTTTEDKNETLLSLEHALPKGQTSKGYRFPTPFITKKSFKFSDPPEPSANLEPPPKYGRRRSKSTSQMNDAMSRTVTFVNSPVEIVSVVDIDKRWNGGASRNNVTSRRKRSKSLEERSCFTSRLPKPKFQRLVKPKPVTPSQVKMRTKVPDFTAIHQKQFAKMESLIDHMDRKAERAKILTTSALKKPPGSIAKKAQSSTSVAERAEGARPKALKKIDMTADRTVVVENLGKKLPPSRLPLKSALNVTASAPRPAFNLATTSVKTFNTTLSSKPAAESQKDKLEMRRQRHMAMFKGRTAPRAEAEKSNIIRGVRLNRRFELQMQHRKHLEED